MPVRSPTPRQTQAECQHTSQVTGETHVQQEQEILHELFDSIVPLMGDKAGTGCPSSRSHLAEEKLAWWEDREGNNIPALCSERKDQKQCVWLTPQGLERRKRRPKVIAKASTKQSPER